MNKPVYLCNLTWAKLLNGHDVDGTPNFSDKGGVHGKLVFNNTMTYEEYRKINDKVFLFLTDTDLKKVYKDIDKVIEDLKGTLKINRHYIEKTKYGKSEWICMDIDHIQELIDMLEEVKENE